MGRDESVTSAELPRQELMASIERMNFADAIVLVPRSGEQLSVADLKTHCPETLAEFKRPKCYFGAGSLPKNASRKILQRELRQQFVQDAGQ